MKKTRFIALALVVAIALMGAGYAAWQDRITVETTINTGELEIAIKSSEDPKIEIFDAAANEWRDAEDYSTLWGWAVDPGDVLIGQKIDGDKKVEYTFSNMYPGTRGTTEIKVENVGSVPVRVMANVETEILDYGKAGEGELKDKIIVTGNVVFRNRFGHMVYSASIGDDVGLNNLADRLNEILEDERALLAPGYRVSFTGDPENVPPGNNVYTKYASNKMTFTIPYGEELQFLDGEGNWVGNRAELEQLKVTVDFDFVQHNLYDLY